MESKPDPKLQVLQFQNQKLSGQLEEKRRENKALHDKLTLYEKQQQEHAQTLLCVNRIWELLNKDIQHMCTLANSSVQVAKGAGDAVVLSVKDPFLRRLMESDQDVAKVVGDKLRQMEAEQTVVEQALLLRAESTKAALALVLESLQSQQEGMMQLDLKLKDSATDSLVKAEFDRVLADSTNLRKELNKSKGLQLTLEDQLKLAEDRHLEAEERAKKLQNELADAEQDLTTLQRKLSTVKNSGGISEAGTPGTPKIENNCTSSTGALDSKNLDDAELQELQELLDKRAADFENERDAHIRTQRELQEALSKLNDESWVIHTNLYQLASREIQGWKTAIQEKQKEVEVLQREKDEAYRDASIRSHQQMELIMEKNKTQAFAVKIRELQYQKADNDRVRQELEVQLQKEREKLGAAKTVQELKLMVQTLQTEIETLQAHISKNKVAAEKVEQSAREVQETYSKLEAKDLEIKRLQQRLGKKDSELEEHTKKETELKERINDLQAFVEVLTTYCNETQDMAELRASEQALKQEVAQLKNQLEGHELHKRLQQLESVEASLKDRLDQASCESDSLRLEVSGYQRQVADLNQQLAKSKAECDAYVSEIEVTGKAYEDMQAQNMRLLQQVTERDEISNQYVAERIKLNQQQQQLAEQLNQAKSDMERCSKDLHDMTAVKEALEKEINKQAIELVAVKEQLRSQLARTENSLRELREREEANAALIVQLESSKSLAETRGKALESEIDKHSKAQIRGQRLEEDNKVLLSKLEKMKKSHGSTVVVKDLQDEVDAMRTLLNCNVCHERQKNVIITKCCHMFCQKCIQRSLETRNRKCPGCGHAFSQADVKQFFFT